MGIKLTANEERICDLLDKVATSLRTTKPHAEPVTLRIAGGWVRDKLLGKDSGDLDIAIDTMSGYNFALAVQSYMSTAGMDLNRHIAKIAANPEKSKHLETATTTIFGESLDFVNLRSETYSGDSRIPVASFGTPLDDALRRDITINSLFYNIHDRKVEDFTNKGLEDLRAGRIRTPLPPQQTFMDDPLRILRVIRFASRFGYAIDDEILQSVHNKEICNAFTTKISRERVGVEIDKMLTGPDPIRALRLLRDFGMFHLVFSTPGPPTLDANIAISAALTMKWILHQQSFLRTLLPADYAQPLPDGDTRNLLLASALLPCRGRSVKEKKREISLAKYQVLTSLKFSVADAENASALLQHSDAFHQQVVQNAQVPSDRKALGLFIRTIGATPLKSRWPLVGLIALMRQLAPEFAPDAQMTSFDGSDSATMTLIRKYSEFIHRVEELNLVKVFELKPILDGKDMSTIFNVRPGPQIALFLEKVIHWQLEHPDGSREECIEWMTTEFDTGAQVGAGGVAGGERGHAFTFD